ncbi:MAG TPA: alpha/beta hydrolase [Burkholderiales bacterium]|nr:alpha/beta hydrolase [Burkholderiales bacterium]
MELNYFEFGEGDPVVFVHGTIGDYRTWGYQFESFAERYQVISYSRRYHYPNTWTGNGSDYSTGLHAGDLAELVRALGIGPVHLIGQSYGAAVAAHCARHYPDVVSSLVVVEPSLVPWLEEIEGGMQSFEPFSRVRQDASRAMSTGDAQGAVQIFCDGVLGEGTYASLSPEMQAVMLDNAPELKAELEAPSLISTFTFDDARGIGAPTLSMEGGVSLSWLRKIARKFASLVPDVETVVAENSPHAVHFVAPERFNALVLDFLGRHPRR